MSTERNTWVEAIAKMIKLTQEGKLIWTAQPPVDASAGGEFVYITKYKDHTLRLYDMEDSLGRAFGGRSPALEFIDEDGHTLWTYPQVEPLKHLLLSVEYQAAGVKDFLKEILSEA